MTSLALKEGLRSLFFLKPRWDRLGQPTARDAGVLIFLLAVLLILADRLGGAVPATFNAAAVYALGFSLAITGFVAWCAGERNGDAERITPARVFVVLIANAIFLVVASLPYRLFLDVGRDASFSPYFVWFVWLTLTIWSVSTQIFVVMRSRTTLPRIMQTIVLFGALYALEFMVEPPRWWKAEWSGHTSGYSRWDAERAARPSLDELTVQAGLLSKQLSALAPQTAGVVDVYVVTFTPYAGEDVFLREHEVVINTMRSRFGAGDRVVRLINHPTTFATNAVATLGNLRETLAAIGKIADPNEDVVFLHLASHGGKNATLSAEFEGFKLQQVNAGDVRKAFDDAGIGARIISISACYSGSWLPALSMPKALVITASDAEHTSYGCGHESDLTYYTRAMFVEALHETRSFEQALAIARPVIKRREDEAGKDDGFSNPQIFVGEQIRPYLSGLEAR